MCSLELISRSTQALIKAYNEDKPFQRLILRSTAGVMFFGTPHAGARIASAAGLLDKCISHIIHQPRSQLLQEMATESGPLLEMSQNFIGRTAGMRIVSFYETHVMKPQNTVVCLLHCPSRHQSQVSRL